MTELGMDVDAMRSVATGIGACADALGQVLAGIDRLVRTLPSTWTGPDAQRFASQTWPSIRRQLIAVQSDTSALRDSAVREIEQQQIASSAWSGTPGTQVASSTRDVVDAFKDRPADELFRIDTVVGPDGVVRYVVYINGTSGDLDDPSTWDRPHGWGSSIPASFGVEDPTTMAMLNDALRRRLADDGNPNAEVMLIGYSRGGMTAQTLANEREFNITQVMTIGSPEVPTVDGYGGAHVTRLYHDGDQVENLTELGREDVLGPVGAAVLSVLAPDSGNVNTFRAGTPGFFAHDVATGDYDWLADQYDTSANPADVLAHEQQGRFFASEVVATESQSLHVDESEVDA